MYDNWKDIITYRVKEVAPMRFEEVTEGTGVSWSSRLSFEHQSS